MMHGRSIVVQKCQSYELRKIIYTAGYIACQKTPGRATILLPEQLIELAMAGYRGAYGVALYALPAYWPESYQISR